MSIPRMDPNFTMVDLQNAADKFMAAASEYWEAIHKAGLDVGAVVWLERDGETALYTRGEYRHLIMQNIPKVGRTYSFGGATND